MAFWIYKCNSHQHPHQVAFGDWDEFFARRGNGEWGSTKIVPELAKASRGDVILAYQTDRNELVGVTRVVRLRPLGGYLDLILEPLEELRVKVRPLKRSSRAIARIPALQPGPIRTLYTLSSSEADRLLRAARARYKVDLQTATEEAQEAMAGGGFGSAEENRRVEQAAVAYVRKYFRDYGWAVRDVSSTPCGYDLECRRRRDLLHVEVKGTRSSGQKFILTRNEAETWKCDKHFRLALVTSVFDRPNLFQFRGPNSFAKIEARPIAFVCVPKSF